MVKEIRLKVMEAISDDAYRGIARVDGEAMRQLGIRPGDTITVKGERETVAIADRAYPADIGESVIRIDGIIRRNAKTGIGEIISISKAEIKEAKKIMIAPAQQGVVIHANPDIFKRGLLGRAVVKGDLIVMGSMRRRNEFGMGMPFDDIMDMFEFSGFPFSSVRFVVANTNPKEVVIVTETTELVVSPKAIEISEEKVPEVTYEDIGGLHEEVKKIREMVELPLKHPEIFERLGIDAPKGVLLFGPPGTGKTLLAKAVANESDATFLLLNAPEVMSKFYGDSEKRIRDLFEQAEKNAPSIVFIDEIDAIAPKREESYGEVERRVVSQLLTCMDGLKSRGKVVVIGATNRPNALDPALRRPGRFDREVSINVPDKGGRLAILKIHARTMPLEKVDLEHLASITHGFVGADLAALCKEAAMNILRKVLPSIKLKENEPIPIEVLNKLKVSQKDFEEALKIVRPSAMREVLVESPNVKWQEVGGLDEVKQELKEAVEWPIKHPESFKRMGIRPPRGILLFGPPGTGKTLLAKAVATESEANFIQVKGPSLLSMWVGESEKGIRKIFERARQVSPCVIFFDEIDSIAARRGIDAGSRVTERVLNQMLAEMDGLEELNDIVVIGATNRPDMLDSAILRPGRFDRIILIPVPNRKSREAIFKIHTNNMPLAKEVSLDKLVDKAEGFVGADIEAICREAALLALRENMNAKEIFAKHFEDALKKVKPSVSAEESKFYKEVEAMLKAHKIKPKQEKEKPSYFG